MVNSKYVYVKTTNSIGVILESGCDNMGEWYKTDCDGVREATELVFLYSIAEVERCVKQHNANIAPSTRKMIGI